jgi:hypothetical protein
MMAERWSHWTAEGSIRIEDETLAGQTLYRLSIKLKDDDGKDLEEVFLDRCFTAGRALEALLDGEYDYWEFQPSQLGVPANLADWNGHY